MPDTAILVENLSKSYLVGHRVGTEGRYKYSTLRDVIGREVRHFARKAADFMRGRQIVHGDEVEEFWALRNINFEVQQGEVVGIIGQNGAGKSTLLKILSRITDPTNGRIKLRGRVASLLEVGTGFHPELTGRENIYLNGAILGMTRREIQNKFDEMVAFADVGKFLDTPVKRYSSGMYVRLAFAVAAHLEPEILVVDEVLAVGDANFQKKCLGKMSEVSRMDGRTVLFVSHNMGTLTSLCPTTIWLERGVLQEYGQTRSIVTKYLSGISSNQERLIPLTNISRPMSPDRFRLESIEWLSELPLRHGEPLRARIVFTTQRPVSDVSVGFGFSSYDGKRLLSYDTDFPDCFRPSIAQPGSYEVEVAVDSLPLAPDIYAFDIGCRSGDFHALDYIAGVFQIEVIAGPRTPGSIMRKDAGVRLASEWRWSWATSQTLSGND